MTHAYIDHPVHDRLYFAERRLNDLRALNGGDLAGAPPRQRQAVLQEFFFHLCGAIDFLAQTVNEVWALGLDADDVTVSKVCAALGKKHPQRSTRAVLSELHPATR